MCLIIQFFKFRSFNSGRTFLQQMHVADAVKPFLTHILTFIKILTELLKIYEDPHKAGFVEMLIHEQYFYEDYCAYIPKYEEIVLTAARFWAERGYQGALMHEVMFEKFRSDDLPQE